MALISNTEMDYYPYGKDKHVVETSHCSQKRPSRSPWHKWCTSHQLLQSEQHCNSETALLQECVAKRPAVHTLSLAPPLWHASLNRHTERTVRRSHCMNGEPFWAHKHWPQGSEESIIPKEWIRHLKRISSRFSRISATTRRSPDISCLLLTTCTYLYTYLLTCSISCGFTTPFGSTEHEINWIELKWTVAVQPRALPRISNRRLWCARESSTPLVRHAAAVARAATPLRCRPLVRLVTTAQPCVPNMHEWINIARSYKTKNSSCLVVDYYNKSERKLARSMIK